MVASPPNDEPRTIVERFKVCWDTFPEHAGTNHERKQVGFTIELYGTHDHPGVTPTAGCQHCIPVLQALLSLAAQIIPPPWRTALESVRARSGLEYAVERAGRPDVVVAVTMLPSPESGLSECLADIKLRLQELGAAERAWRPMQEDSARRRVATPTG